MEAVRRAADLDVVLTSSPACTSHDETSALLRNGLSVVGFALLEDFIARRTEELLAHISSGQVAFVDLPEKLQSAATENALSVLVSRVRRMRSASEDPLSVIQEAAESIASTSGTNLRMPAQSLGWPGSNLGADDVKAALLSLGVGGDPWHHITEIARRAGFNIQNSRNAFIDLMKGRHGAAHDAQHTATVVAVRSLPNSAAAIALGFDALASRCARLCSAGDPGYLGGATVREEHIRFRYLDQVGSQWKEYLEGRPNRARKVSSTQELAVSTAITDTQTSEHAVIVERTGGRPGSWVCGDLP